MDLFKKLFTASFYPDRCPYCDTPIEITEIACKKCFSDFPQQMLKRYTKGSYKCCSRFLYKENYREAIIRFKFKDAPNLSQKLVHPLADAIKECAQPEQFNFVTYVPMHKNKINIRGYNQAQLLAEELSTLLNITGEDLLIKTVDNLEQHNFVSVAERMTNVIGVYSAVNKDKIKNSRILLIDDVITTGSTLGECCKTLKKAGAKEIFCATVCATK